MKYLSLITMQLFFLSGICKAQFVTIPIQATEAYNGQFAKGTLTIRYANPDHILRRPLLVVEGFDPGHITSPEDKFGESDITGFLADLTNDATFPAATALQQLLVNVPQYDIVYLDWAKGTDYIQRNALLVEQAIRRINTDKQPLAGVIQRNVVLGQSMGGLAARYALRRMENNGQVHQTRLFISYDSPQQGANVPQGYQHLARHARDLYIQTGVTAGVIETIQLIRGAASPLRALSVANEPASRQMLINYVNDLNAIDNSVHNQWQLDLRTMGYPNGNGGIPFEKVAVSNGSECGIPQPFSAGANLLTYQGKARTTFLSDLGLSGIVFSTAAGLLNQPAFVLGVLPGRNEFNFDFAVNAKANGTANQVYKGKITYTKKIMWIIPVNVVITNRSYNAAAATLPYDYYPGGYYDLKANGLDLQSASSVNYWTRYNINVSYQPTFCFVPTPSALDIGSGTVTLTHADYLSRYSGGTALVTPKTTPFLNFITAPNSGNEPHISIRRRNGDWVAEELNGNNPVSNCAFLCNPNGAMTITGPAAVCNNPVVYNLTNPPAGTNITWTSSPLGMVDIAAPGTGPQANVSRSGAGYVTLIASVGNAACGTINISSATLRAGGFSSSDYPVSGPSSACKNQSVYFNTSTLSGATSYNWFWPSDWSYSGGQGTQYLTLMTGSSIGSGMVGVRVANVCDAGGSPGTKFVQVNSCGFRFATSPNPAKGSTTISTIQTQTKSTKAKTSASVIESKIYMIKVMDQFGNVKKQYNYRAGITKININLNSLLPGMYTIQAFDGDAWGSQLFIKQ